jgi:hypothetical protein
VDVSDLEDIAFDEHSVDTVPEDNKPVREVPSQKDRDAELVVQATRCFLNNPLGCVAYDAYGVLLLQLLRSHTQWPAINKLMVNIGDTDVATDEPHLIHLGRVHPSVGMNPLSAQDMHTLVDNLMETLTYSSWTHVDCSWKIIAESIRVTYTATNVAGIEFIMVSKQPQAKGQ